MSILNQIFPFIIGAIFILVGLGIVWRQRRKRRRELAVLYGGSMNFKDRRFDSGGPRATGEVYTPTTPDDIPGWEKP